ncbi:MAG TPA: Gfo/Idh/MocA family oxidoreductase [Pirellulaceae bacterium]|nr:Gfo/Idh/MocA family oxidoreductase [Pirellulaceae bacterium]
MTTKQTRRRFLQTAAAASAVFAVPQIIPARAFGANERVNLGFVGVKNRGMQNMGGFAVLGSDAGKLGCAAAGLCDVDTAVLASAANRAAQSGAKPHVAGDYRHLLDRKDIDAIVVSTPDHWHALITVDACRAGKDVYCEKPLTLFVTEGRRMVEVARETGRVVQTGSQQRSDDRFRQACELVRNGALGKLQKVLVGIPKPNYPPLAKAVPDSDPPPELNYELWLGPAPWRPYNVNRVHYNFRFFWDYSGGQMTNFGAHHLDIAQWGLGADDSGPIAIEGTGTFPKEKHLCEVTDTCRLTYSYPDGVEVILGQAQKDIPDAVTFIGEKGQIHVTRGAIKADPPEILKTELGADAVKLTVSKNHYANFLDCVKSREKPICDVEIGHRSATVCHLGNMAIRLGRKIQWDPAKEQILGDDGAAAMLTRPYREPWKLG